MQKVDRVFVHRSADQRYQRIRVDLGRSGQSLLNNWGDLNGWMESVFIGVISHCVRFAVRNAERVLPGEDTPRFSVRDFDFLGFRKTLAVVELVPV